MTTSRSAQAAAEAVAARDIFAGGSRTHYLIDPAIAAEMMGRSRGAAVRTAYEAGEPLTARGYRSHAGSVPKRRSIINITP